MKTPSAPPRRRQPRGERRIDQILGAAAAVFAEVGYAAATTNAIAARAGISPGSLYQFFSNKEAVAVALAERWATQLGAAHETALAGAETGPLGEVLDRVVDPIVAFELEHAGFGSLLADPAVPARVSAASTHLQDRLVARVEDVLAHRSPRTPVADRRRVAIVTVQMVKALLPVIAAAGGSERAAFVAELKRAMRAYLEPLESRPDPRTERSERATQQIDAPRSG